MRCASVCEQKLQERSLRTISIWTGTRRTVNQGNIILDSVLVRRRSTAKMPLTRPSWLNKTKSPVDVQPCLGGKSWSCCHSYHRGKQRPKLRIVRSQYSRYENDLTEHKTKPAKCDVSACRHRNEKLTIRRIDDISRKHCSTVNLECLDDRGVAYLW